MKDANVAAFAANHDIVVHALHEDGAGGAVPRCGDESGKYVLSSAARADVTCEPCQVGLPERMPCGRIDDHDDHDWQRPRLVCVPAAAYWCPGTPVIEGGARA